MHRLSTLAGLAPKISELVHELQKERGKSAGFVSAAGQGQAARKLADQRSETDHRLQAANQTSDGFDAAAYGNTFVTKLQ